MFAKAAREILYTCGNSIEAAFTQNSAVQALAADAWKDAISLHKRVFNYYATNTVNQSIIDRYSQLIGKYDTEYSQKALQDSVEKLQSSIKKLEDELDNTPKRVKWNGFGIFLIVLTVLAYILIRVGVSMLQNGVDMDETFVHILFYQAFIFLVQPGMMYIRIGLFVLGFIIAIPKKKKNRRPQNET